MINCNSLAHRITKDHRNAISEALNKRNIRIGSHQPIRPQRTYLFHIPRDIRSDHCLAVALPSVITGLQIQSEYPEHPRQVLDHIFSRITDCCRHIQRGKGLRADTAKTGEKPVLSFFLFFVYWLSAVLAPLPRE